jgi:hypothetical protein
MTVTPQLRAILIASVLALTAAALGFYTLSQSNKGGGDNDTTALPPAASLVTPAKTPKAVAKPHKAAKPQAAKPHAASKPGAVSKPKTATKPATTFVTAKPTTSPFGTSKPKIEKPNAFVLAAKAAGLPTAIANALGKNKVVVVALYTPHLKIDGVTKAEAKAGAKLAKAGFIAVNVRTEGTSAALTRLMGVLDAPVVLIFRRPGELFMKLDGYSDSDTIGQAALNAALPPMSQ